MFQGTAVRQRMIDRLRRLHHPDRRLLELAMAFDGHGRILTQESSLQTAQIGFD